jgi:5-methylcytosine-specific restriction protein B
VLLKLLPYNDFPAFREKGAWIHVAPTPGDPAARIKSKWPNDWPQSAQAILHFIRRCNEHPDQLTVACEEFSRSPYSSGIQTGRDRLSTPVRGNRSSPNVALRGFSEVRKYR